MVHTFQSIRRLLRKPNYPAVYRALVLMHEEGRLTGRAKTLALEVIEWEKLPADVKARSGPLDSADLAEAVEIACDFAFRLAEISNAKTPR